MQKQDTEQQTDIVPAPPVPFAVKFFIIAFTLSYVSFVLYLVVDTWVHEQALLRGLLDLKADDSLPPNFHSATYAVLGSILGAGALGLVSFHRHVSVKQDFQLPHVWGYFVAPWLSAVLGLIVFALLQTGLLVFSGGTTSGQNTDISHMGYLMVGFLSGFGWVQAVEKIREVVNRFFAASPKDTKSSKEPETPVGKEDEVSTGVTNEGSQKSVAAVPAIVKGSEKA